MSHGSSLSPFLPRLGQLAFDVTFPTTFQSHYFLPSFSSTLSVYKPIFTELSYRHAKIFKYDQEELLTSELGLKLNKQAVEIQLSGFGYAALSYDDLQPPPYILYLQQLELQCSKSGISMIEAVDNFPTLFGFGHVYAWILLAICFRVHFLVFSILEGETIEGLQAVCFPKQCLTGREPNVIVNPDEVVTFRAVVQAGVLAGDVSDIVSHDPLDLKPLVREFVRDNKPLGSFRLNDIPPVQRGVTQIEVKFDIDANGILYVTAIDTGTGKKQDITITNVSTLPNDDVQRMVNEAGNLQKKTRKKEIP
ncbi:hypothetical protein L2E82_28013 [Cichorium intybus]|uniref:Uncharacterized protein n=1 Tax=Cichorium intybus TaxID=13427 RepID=A0ACB9CUQ4_CICIN|nr:hypothetical protein L2E82_28013 [Cichorium intybus]